MKSVLGAATVFSLHPFLRQRLPVVGVSLAALEAWKHECLGFCCLASVTGDRSSATGVAGRSPLMPLSYDHLHGASETLQMLETRTSKLLCL